MNRKQHPTQGQPSHHQYMLNKDSYKSPHTTKCTYQLFNDNYSIFSDVFVQKTLLQVE